ncbi:hypothetical protein AAE478_008140 [Parahypoxylon ruwenzoriense]
MCFKFSIHHTTRKHDTRFLSIVNPITGFTVFSPWQEPYKSYRTCDYPCVVGHIPLNEQCSCHWGCCRLVVKEFCRGDASTCGDWVKYHHFVFDGEPETGYEDFLRVYVNSDKNALKLIGWTYKAGVEFALADMYRAQAARRLAQAGMYGGRNAIDAVEGNILQERIDHFSNVVVCATECLSQFARLWDVMSERLLLPPRPGAHPDQEQSAAVMRKWGVEVGTWARHDAGIVLWPNDVELWPGLRAGLLPFGDDPAMVPWLMAPGADGVFQPPLAAPASFPELSLNPQPMLVTAQQIPQLSFDPTVSMVQTAFSPDALPPPVLSPFPQSPMDSQPSWIGRITPSTSSTETSPSPDDSEGDFYPSSTPSSSSSCDDESDGDYEDVVEVEDEDEQMGETPELDKKEYAVEALLNHRPRGVPRRRVAAYRVRWAGDWPPDQKEMWVHRRDIAVQLIDNYWATKGKEEKGSKK